MKIHTLASGATVVITSPGHGFKFSDGTVAEAQDANVCSALTLVRSLTLKQVVKGMACNEVRMVLDTEQVKLLKLICQQADIVLIPFPMLSALREQGIRDQFPNALAMNATPETQRSPPTDKVVDVNNWSY